MHKVSVLIFFLLYVKESKTQCCVVWPRDAGEGGQVHDRWYLSILFYHSLRLNLWMLYLISNSAVISRYCAASS